LILQLNAPFGGALSSSVVLGNYLQQLSRTHLLQGNVLPFGASSALQEMPLHLQTA